MAQFFKFQETFLICVQQPFYAFLLACNFPVENFFPFLDGVGISYFLKPSLDFLANQCRILQQLDDLFPDGFI